jgi:hypothetical protein
MHSRLFMVYRYISNYIRKIKVKVEISINKKLEVYYSQQQQQ